MFFCPSSKSIKVWTSIFFPPSKYTTSDEGIKCCALPPKICLHEGFCNSIGTMRCLKFKITISGTPEIHKILRDPTRTQKLKIKISKTPHTQKLKINQDRRLYKPTLHTDTRRFEMHGVFKSKFEVGVVCNSLMFYTCLKVL